MKDFYFQTVNVKKLHLLIIQLKRFRPNNRVSINLVKKNYE